MLLIMNIKNVLEGSFKRIKQKKKVNHTMQTFKSHLIIQA